MGVNNGWGPSGGPNPPGCLGLLGLFRSCLLPLALNPPGTSEVGGICFIALHHKAFDGLLSVFAKLDILTLFYF